MVSFESADRPAPAFDCRNCGACCASPWTGNGYVVVDGEESRLRRAGVLTVTLRYGGPTGFGQLVEKLGTVRDEAGRFVCAEFDGRIAGPSRCRIYEDRPVPCRRLEPGSDACLDARRREGFPDGSS